MEQLVGSVTRCDLGESSSRSLSRRGTSRGRQSAYRAAGFLRGSASTGHIRSTAPPAGITSSEANLCAAPAELDSGDAGEVVVRQQLVDNVEEAERVGFRGSPTIVLEGHDPFAVPVRGFSAVDQLPGW